MNWSHFVFYCIYNHRYYYCEIIIVASFLYHRDYVNTKHSTTGRQIGFFTEIILTDVGPKQISCEQ